MNTSTINDNPSEFTNDIRTILQNTFGLRTWWGTPYLVDNRLVHKIDVPEDGKLIHSWSIIVKPRKNKDTTYALICASKEGDPYDFIYPTNMYEVTLWLNHVITYI